MDKQTKRELKKRTSGIFKYLLIAFPVLLLLISLLYAFVPSLVEHQWVVIALVVVLGGAIYLVINYISRKLEEKKEKEPKKKDPFAD